MDLTSNLPQMFNDAILTVFDYLPFGLLLLDDKGKLLLANEVGKRALQNGRTVVARNGVVSLAGGSPSDFAPALTAPREGEPPFCKNIPHPPGKPCSVMVAALPKREEAAPRPDTARADINGCAAPPVGCPASIVLIGDPDLEYEPEASRLSQLFRVTDAQARVAVLLMRGKTVEEVASQLSITQHTARNHLKRLFSKTQTKKQAELVQLLMSSPAVVRTPTPKRDPSTFNHVMTRAS